MIGRARARVEELISGYQRPLIQSAHENAVLQFAEHEARRAGLDTLPGLTGVAAVK